MILAGKKFIWSNGKHIGLSCASAQVQVLIAVTSLKNAEGSSHIQATHPRTQLNWD